MVDLLVLLPHRGRDELLRDAERHGHAVVGRCDTPDALLPLLAASPTAVALVAASHDLLTASVLTAADAAGVRLIAVAASSAERLHAAGLGLHEVVESRAGWDGIEEVIGGAARRRGNAASARSTVGQLIAVWGAAGAPGRTTVAITLAAEFAALGHRVILVDADTHAAAIAPALGLAEEAPGFAAACRLAAAGSLTVAEMTRVAQTYSSVAGSFQVLTGLPRPALWPELGGPAIASTLAECRTYADVVVVDVASSLEHRDQDDASGVTRNIATRTAIAAADRVISVGSADPVGLSRFLRGHADLLEVATGEVTVLVNRVRASAIGFAPRDQVAQALARFGDIRSAVLVPDDRPAFDAAILAGRTVTDAMPRSGARGALSALAAELLPPPRPAPERRGRRLSKRTR
ncbi:MinD-like ATPase involved in chromosome partitioning or flagellar assembly [Leifsonia sp. AK011]|uniref:tyrosine-protein kinase family protein n=1 Tax=Leifsonia sp. AK011 TaxID=2723075 RepID=UPI0015CC83D7|nr:tyrosine-protein kinase family protein [Leifsonia sp. AK011]NYF11489.1 MinD-like ATPase involved in chromosome partitioning or flagellar assembly [Leifsonia sp. AK011]